MAEVTFQYEVPFGHRLMLHEGKCRFPHGHNYVFDVSVRGPIGTIDAGERAGMVLDFADLKRVVRQFFEPFDHAMVLYERDTLVELLRQIGRGTLIKEVPGEKDWPETYEAVPTKVVVLDDHPTAENLAWLLRCALKSEYGLYTVVTCYETSDCAARSAGRESRDDGPKIVEMW